MLDIINIHKTFNKGTINEKVALDGVTLHLNEGDFCTIIGGNGAGKSTTLNAVAGVWPVDSGQILIDGVDVTGLPEHKRAKYLGRVFQDPMTGTVADMEILENLALAARRGKKRGLSWGVKKSEKEEYRTLLKQFELGLENRMTSKVGLLSGGQRQAIALLMSTMTPIDFLILDEHTAALDPKTAELIMELTGKIVEEKNGGKPVKVVANLPYYITTPIIMGLFENQVPVDSITIMVQKEVADRMQVGPGTKDYGALSLAVQYYAKPKIVANVPPNCFMPRPKVGSAVIRLERYEKPPVEVKNEKLMFRIIRASFNQRRKTLVNGLKNSQEIPFSKEQIEQALGMCGLSLSVRGEALTLAQFAQLANAFTEIS